MWAFVVNRRWMRPEDHETAHELDRNLRKIVDPEEADVRCKADQARKRSDLAASGQLFDELDKRGYQRNPNRLIPDTEVIFAPSKNPIL